MKIALTFLFSLLSSYYVFAQQPVADFKASSTSGCSPVVVAFTDQSSGSPKLWNWDFGNGQLSNLQNPTVSFNIPGTYTIKLVVKNADGVNGITKTDYIIVNPSPTALFSGSTTLACAPSTVLFTDKSTANAGTITEWKWNFSDGTTYNTQNVPKQFTTPGFYDVFLTVKSSTGCQATTGTNRYLRVIAGLKTDFVSSDPKTCRPPFPVDFTNQTSGPGDISYNWDLGNGASSALTNPTGTYNSAGSYTVKLSAESSLGCKGSAQKTITLAEKQTLFNGPANICLNIPANFKNNSVPDPVSVLWNFGDGGQSIEFNPAKSYNTPGLYTVKLYSTFSNCTDSATKVINVLNNPTINFTATKTGICNVPVVVNFQNTSPDAVSAVWDFGDGTGTSSTPSHSYTANGSYDVTLTITDSKGCKSTLTKPAFIQVAAPLIRFNKLPAGGCGPSFTYTPDFTITSPDGVASYAWDFGDGTPIDNSPTPTHTYTKLGSFTVTLTIKTNGGCTATKIENNAVSVGSAVTVDFDKNASVACNSSGVTFKDLSTPAGTSPSTKWLWDFGDNTTSDVQNPFHKYKDTGYFNITLTVTTNGCPTTVKKTKFVFSSPPVAVFTDTVLDCADKRSVKFTDKSITRVSEPLTYKWIFGDASIPNSSLPDNTITYPKLGTYQVMLEVSNGVCKDTAYKTLRLINEDAKFTFNKLNACQNDSIHFTSLNTPSYVKEYVWTVNTIKAGKNNPKFDTSFATYGVFDVQLVILDSNDCKSIKQEKVTIAGPTAAFTTKNRGGCINSPIEFVDASVTTRKITNWSWEFGDGPKQNFTSRPFTHNYKDTGFYNVKLIVTDDIGCKNTVAVPKAARINRVTAAFNAERTITCPTSDLQFNDSSYDKTLYTYAWDFGDGNTSTLQNPIHNYGGVDKTYTVKLSIEDTVGCKNTVIRNNYIKVVKPKPDFEVKDSSSICPPLETKFFFKGKDYESISWDFGDGGSSVSNSFVTHFYGDYGTYKVKLNLIGYGGCIETDSSIVNVYNPNTESKIGYNDITACNSVIVDFALTVPPSTTFDFFYGDGQKESNQALNLQHKYLIPSFYSPALLLKDEQACQVSINGPYQIKVLGAIPLFSKDKKEFCDNGLVYFTDYTITNDVINKREWNFGDGTTDNAINTTHTYNGANTYLPKLTVTTIAGCESNYEDTIRVYRTPTPVINSLDAICKNVFVNLAGDVEIADTLTFWKWNLGNGQTSDKQNVQLSYLKPGPYTVTLEAANKLGCKNTTQKDIIINPIPDIGLPKDTSIIVGTGITLTPTYSNNAASFNWSPTTDLSCTGCSSPYVTPKITTTYKFTVVDGNGCISSKNIKVIVLCNNKNFFIPNTFSPNADGNNDRFYPRGKGIDRIEAFRIFNRWGELVFEKMNFAVNDYQAGWDGTYKGKPASLDTYIYMIDIICENKTVITYKGDITLIK